MPRFALICLLPAVLLTLAVGCAMAEEAAAADPSMVTVTVDGAADPDPEARRFATLRAGAEAAMVLLREGQPVRLRIEPGVYREYVNDVFRGDGEVYRDTPLLIEGADRETVIWSGAVTRQGEEDFGPASWQPVAGYPDVYFRGWPYRLGLENGYWHNNFGVILRNLAARREMLVVDGRLLRQVLMERYDWEDPDGKAGHADWAGGTKDKTNQPGRHVYQGMVADPLSRLDEPWTFGVIDHPLSDSAYAKRIYIRLPEGVTPSDLKQIEVNASNDKNRPLLGIVNKHNLTVRGITFTHAGNAMVRWAVDITGAKNVVVEDCDVIWNGGRGLHVGGEDIVIRGCRISHNGHNGFGAGPRKVLVEDVEANWNNWRGLWGGFTGWSVAAAKFGKVEDITLRRVTMIGNHCGAIWFDIKCRDLLVDQCFIWGNERPGVEFEYSDVGFGNAEVRNSVIAHNLTYGVFISDATDSRVINNVIFHNGGGNVSGVETREQIGLKNGHRKPDTAEQWQQLVIRDNFIAGAGEQRLIGYVHTRTEPDDYAEILKIVRDRNNDYAHPQRERVFQLPDLTYTDLNGWLEIIGGELEQTETPPVTSRWVELSGEAELDFGPDVDTPLMRRARGLGCPLPFAQVEQWRQRQADQREAADMQAKFPFAAKTPVEQHQPISLTGVGNRSVGGSDVEQHGVYLLDPGPGTHTLAGVRFELGEGDRAAIALRSQRFGTLNGQRLPEAIEVPIGRRVQRVYILHGLSYLNEPGRVGQYTLIYEDGSTYSTPVIGGRIGGALDDLGDVPVDEPNINDWWHDRQPLRSVSAIAFPMQKPRFSGAAANHLYALEIINPDPAKPVERVRLSSDPEKQASLVIFAVSTVGSGG